MSRATPQREAIRQAIEAADRPLSPQEILGLAQRDVPQLGIATVYRSVKALLEEGWVREVELPGAPSRYEVADKRHHHHFHCRQCDRVFDLHGCPPGVGGLAPQGFAVESHEIILYGVCRECVAD
ncbi:MAG: Fur family transcriptional regulator [Planctomycetota bacterium]|jgi:Fur family ferric uptake transcriptional regulator